MNITNVIHGTFPVYQDKHINIQFISTVHIDDLNQEPGTIYDLKAIQDLAQKYGVFEHSIQIPASVWGVVDPDTVACLIQKVYKNDEEFVCEITFDEDDSEDLKEIAPYQINISNPEERLQEELNGLPWPINKIYDTVEVYVTPEAEYTVFKDTKQGDIDGFYKELSEHPQFNYNHKFHERIQHKLKSFNETIEEFKFLRSLDDEFEQNDEITDDIFDFINKKKELKKE